MDPGELERLARLIRGQRWAGLGTVGGGSPLASMVAYAPEPGFGGFLMLLSRLSGHTRHLLETPRASLAIGEPDPGTGDPQTLIRVSVQGDVVPVPEGAPGYAQAMGVYQRRLPHSAPRFGFGDFLLFRLVPREARFVAGFGRAYTLTAEDLSKAAFP